MTTENRMIDHRLASTEISIYRQNNWRDTSISACKWLEKYRARNFPHKNFFGILSDASPRPNNRISKYYGFSKSSNVQDYFDEDLDFLGEDYLEVENGIIFYAILSFGVAANSKFLDLTRDNRNSLLCLSMHKMDSFLLDDMMKLRSSGFGSIDARETVQFFCRTK